jgi:hypothetical protein
LFDFVNCTGNLTRMKYPSFFFLFLIFITAFEPAARASAFSLGRLQTVSSDGSLDAIRSPSVLASHNENNALGYMIIYPPFYDHRFDYDAYRSSWLSLYRDDERKYSAGSVYLSYIKKVPGGAVAFAIDADNTYQTVYDRYEKTSVNLNAADQNITLTGGSALTVSPRAVISFGTTIAGNHAIGAQLSLGYTRLNERYCYTGVLNSSIDQRHHANETNEAMNAEISIGYSYRDALSQAGILVRSGRLSLRRTRIYYTHADFTSQLFFAGSVSEPRQLLYDRGFSIIAGGYRNLAGFIAVALEGEYRIPLNYREKELMYDEFTSFYGITINSGVNSGGFYCIRGGFEILPSGPVTINLGGSVDTTMEKRSSRFYRDSVSRDRYAGSLGLDLKFTENFLILLGSQLSYIRERTNRASNYFNTIILDGPVKSLDLASYLGMSFYF